MNINGKHLVVTGAASGIGAALIRQLAAYDAQITVADIDMERLQQTVDAISGSATFHLYQADLSQPEGVDRLFEFALESMGHIDIFVANAGFAYYERHVPADWQRLERIYQLNTISPIYSAARMRDLNPSRPYQVVITASSMAHLAIPGYAVYAGTKSALDRFADGYRREMPANGHLGLVYPGSTRTGFFEAASDHPAPVIEPASTPDEVAQSIISGILHDREIIYPVGYLRWLFQIPPLMWLIRKFALTRYVHQLDTWHTNRPEK